MIDSNRRIHEYTGVRAWHDAGYTGKGIRVATAETLDPSDWPGKSVVSLRPDAKTSNHSAMTTGILFEVAPDTEVYAISTATQHTAEPPYSDLYHIYAPKLAELGINLLFASLTHPSPKDYEREWADEFVGNNKSLVQFWATGNDADQSYNRRLQLPDATGVGAYMLVSNVPVPAYYTSQTEYADFSAPTNVHYQLPKWASSTPGSGTSAATPYLCGMAALVQQLFVEKTGKPLNREALLQFFNDNCIDIGVPGKDDKSGYGAVVLPDPNTVDVWKYQNDGKDDETVSFAKVVCIDPGHGSTCANGSPDGTYKEHEFALDVANRIKTILTRHGVNVVMTRTGGTDVSLTERAKISNDANADLFLSIHTNASGSCWSTAAGWEAFVVTKGYTAEKLAEAIRKVTIPATAAPDRGVKEANYTVLVNTSAPAVLVEHGFHTNKEEVEKLKDDEYRQTLAECDAQGILATLGIAYVPSVPTAPQNPWYTEDMKWAVENGIMDGTRPTEPATRAEVVRMIRNTLNMK